MCVEVSHFDFVKFISFLLRSFCILCPLKEVLVLLLFSLCSSSGVYLLFFIILLRYNSHTRQFTHLKCISFSGFQYITHPLLHSVIEHFHRLVPKPHTPLQSLPIPPIPRQTLESTKLLYVSVDFLILDIS